MFLCYCVHADGDACRGQMHWIPSGPGIIGSREAPNVDTRTQTPSNQYTRMFCHHPSPFPSPLPPSQLFLSLLCMHCVCTIVHFIIILTHHLWWILRSTSNIFDITNNAPQNYLLFFFFIFIVLHLQAQFFGLGILDLHTWVDFTGTLPYPLIGICPLVLPPRFWERLFSRSSVNHVC